MSERTAEVIELFAEASAYGRRLSQFDDALATDIGVLGGGRMPWGDDANFAAWCAEQEPLVRKFFDRVIAERVGAAPLRPPLLPAGWKPPELAPSPLLALLTIEKIAALHGVTYGEVVSPNRTPKVVRARDHAMAVIRWSSKLSLPELGRIFHRDHSSCLDAIERYEQLLNAEYTT